MSCSSLKQFWHFVTAQSVVPSADIIKAEFEAHKQHLDKGIITFGEEKDKDNDRKKKAPATGKLSLFVSILAREWLELGETEARKILATYLAGKGWGRKVQVCHS